MASITLNTSTAKDWSEISARLASYAGSVGDDEDQRVAYVLAEFLPLLIHGVWHDAPDSDFKTTVTVTDSQLDIVIDKS